MSLQAALNGGVVGAGVAVGGAGLGAALGLFGVALGTIEGEAQPDIRPNAKKAAIGRCMDHSNSVAGGLDRPVTEPVATDIHRRPRSRWR
jgi:hypothetical protein